MPNLLEFSPGVDLVTDRVAVVMQDRPLIGMSSWLIDAFAAAGNAGRHLQLVTRPHTRLSYQVRTRLFAGKDSRWVVREPDGDGTYDGLSGLRLAWDGDRFAPVLDDEGKPDLSPAFLSYDREARANLMVEARVRYQALDTTLVGRSAELLFRELTGAVPAGWGTEEPVSQRWNTQAVTAYCRNRAPRGSWLTVVGSPEGGVRRATGSIEVHSHRRGIEEIVRMAVAWPADEKPGAQDAAAVAGTLAAELDVVTLLAMTGPAAPDTSVPAHLLGFPAPLGIALGGDALRALGTDIETTVEGLHGRPVGSRTRPAAWYPVGNGEDQRDWNQVAALANRVAAGERSSRTQEGTQS
jgi:uncharacterized protein DUF6177